MPTNDLSLKGLPRIAVRVGTPDEAEVARKIFERLEGNRIHDQFQDVITGYVTPEIYQALLDAHFMVSKCGLADDEAEQETTPQRGLAPSDQYPAERGVENLQMLEADARDVQALEPDAGLASDDQGETKRVYKVNLRGPMRSQWVDKLKELGISISSFEPPFGYRMLLSDSELAKVSALDFVRGKPERYGLADTLSPEFLDEYNRAIKEGDSTPALFDLTVHEPDQLPRVKSMLESIGAQVLQEAGSSVRFSAPVSPNLAALADKDEVKLLAPFRPMSLMIDVGRTILGLPAPGNAASAKWPWDGTGETVGVVDSGVYAQHPGFMRADGSSRVKAMAIQGLGTDDAVGHGTHVAGIIAASATGSPTPNAAGLVGVAPGANIVSLRIVDDSGQLQLDPDLTDMLETVAREGAKIINMSWASLKISARYDSYSDSVDAFVRKHPDVLVVIAAGNEGSAPDGYPTYSSAGTPATAKNAITVGACHTIRNGFTITYGDYRAPSFPNPPFSALPLAGDSRYVAGFSSRGPTELNAVKPDIVAPGTFILSLRARDGRIPEARGVKNPDSYTTAGYDPQRYLFLHGTSMAAPFVAGAAAVLRHYLREGLHVANPSAALLKAILCASVARADPAIEPKVRDEVGYPDFDQGFGRLNLSSVIPAVTDSGARRLDFVNVDNDSKQALLSRLPKGSSRRSSRVYTVNANQGPLLVVLTWTDSPGRGLQNVLQIDLENRDEGIQIVGNHLHKWAKDRLPIAADPAPIPYDRTNNVQMVSLDTVPAGSYRITVRADNTPIPDIAQGYALCVRGNLASELKEVTP